MSRLRRLMVTVLCGLTTYTAGQTASSLNLSGLTTNVLSPPGQPYSFNSLGCGSGTSHTWTYAIVAADATGATTSGSLTNSTGNNCVSLSPTTPAYVTFTTQAVAGAVSCFVYRTAVPGGSAQHIGKLPNPIVCGQVFYDTGATDGDGTSPPTTNVTGSVSASGNVSATSFQAAGGTTAGTSVWVQGGQMSGCGSPPCIPTTGAFFLDAPNSSITTSYGWTAPGSANSGNTLLFLHPPGSPVGGVATSAFDYVTAGVSNQVLLGNTSTAPSFGQVPNGALVNSSITVNTTAPLTGGATVSLGSTLPLSVSNASTSATGVVQLAGDLGGTGTAPSVLKVHGATYPATGSSNQVPVVTAMNTVTYEAVPNGALANSSVTVNTSAPLNGGGALSLGGSLTLSASNATGSTVGVLELAGDLSGTATAPSVVSVHGASYPATGSSNQVPVVTATNTITYEAVPNAALANSSITVPVTSPITGGGSGSLGGSTSAIACATCAVGPGSSVATDLVVFNSTDGVTLSDSGISSSSLTSLMWSTVRTSNTTMTFPASPNVNLYCVALDTPITVSRIAYTATGSDTSHFYDIGIYSGTPGNSATLIAETGKQSGTTFATGNQLLSGAPITIPRGGPVCLAITTSCVGACTPYAMGATSNSAEWGTGTTSAGTAGQLPSSGVTMPAVSPSAGTIPAWILY